MTQPEIIDPQDWATIWQSELSALAVDREAHETLAAMAQLWQPIAHDRPPPGNDGPAGRAGPDAAAGAAAVGAASGDGDGLAELWAQLRRRIAELERDAASRG